MSKDMSQRLFTELGLNTTEGKIYDILLRIGEAPSHVLVEESKLKRPTVYKTLYDLEKKQLVSKRDIRNIIHFKAESPSNLLKMAEEQIREKENVRDDLRAVLPHLLESYGILVEKPVVTVYEGLRGLKKMYEDTLIEAQPVFAILQTAEVDKELYDWLTKVYVKKRVAANIHASVIVSSGKWAEEYIQLDEKQLRDTVLVPEDIYPFAHEVDIYGDKVAFMQYKQGEALIGVLIHHPRIAQTMKALFKLAWKGALAEQRKGG